MHFSVQIRPQWDKSSGTVSALDLTLKTDRPVKAGEDLAARILTIVNIPFCPMEPASFSDEAGEIPVEARKGEAEMSFIHREFYRSLRDTVGETVIRYRITPRVQPEGYRSSPYFDLVAEKGGVLGTGTTFLLHPPVLSEEADFSLRWDLSGLPEGSRGVWSLGTGDCEKRLTVSDILFSAYMAGQVKAIEEGKAGFYWFGETPFPAEACAGEITRLFNYMSKLFRDKGGDYRVFTRRNHFPGGGGTALTRSYIYAYGEGDAVTVEELQSLLAHEMVHNWPTLRDDPPGAGTWYVEGSAEYYSTLIPLEMGICSPRRTADIINEKAGSYYENPMQGLDNLELGKRYWTDRRCQRLPYARGILYLSNLDAEIRRRTAGQKTLLDIELALLQLESPTAEDFLRAGSEIAGFDLRPGYEDMCAGKLPPPDPDAFGGKFRVVPCKVKLNNAQHRADRELLDEESDGYRWEVKE